MKQGAVTGWRSNDLDSDSACFDFSLYVIKNVTLQPERPLIRIQTSVWGSWLLNGPRRCKEMMAAGWVCLCWQSKRRGRGGEKGTRGKERVEKTSRRFVMGRFNLFIWTAPLPIYAWVHILCLPLLLLCYQCWKKAGRAEHMSDLTINNETAP